MASAQVAAICPQGVFEFADLALDTRQRAVFRGLQRIPLPKLTYELLLALVEAAPALMTHEELVQRVWRGRLTSPETLNQRVLLLRHALGDEAGSPRYLRVVRGQGYQLIPPVRLRRSPDARLPVAMVPTETHVPPGSAGVTATPGKDAVRKQLRRILDSDEFVNATVLKRFLQHVVEHHLREDAAPLKEYGIGVDVLGRGTDFDPRVDTIVRVHAQRLRARLAAYYAGPGRSDPVRIDIPKGHYAAVVAWNPPVVEAGPHTGPAGGLVAPAAAGGQPDGFNGLATDIDLSLPDQPSIVVLPFDAGDDPEHRDFARGLTHDILSRVGRTRTFFVIARGSAYRFAPGPQDLREVSRRLGVRYVVQGDVRLNGAAMRVDVALADAVEGRELWAETFQCKREGVFETQEEITDLIVAEIASEVELAEQQRALLETPANLDAWSAYHRGCWHMYRFTPQDFEQAERCFDLSARLDPKSARALTGLSFVHWQRAFFDLTPDRSGEIQQALELAQRSHAINPREPLAHWALGRAHLLRGEMDEAIAALGTATDMNPSFAVGQYSLGFALMQAGDTVRSIERADKARRLSPYDPLGFAMLGVRGFSLALDGQYEQAAELLALAIRQPNAHYHMVAMAAVCSVLAGHEVDARRDLARLLEARPGYGEREFLHAFQFRQPAHTRLIADAFRRLGRLRRTM